MKEIFRVARSDRQGQRSFSGAAFYTTANSPGRYTRQRGKKRLRNVCNIQQDFKSNNFFSRLVQMRDLCVFPEDLRTADPNFPTNPKHVEAKETVTWRYSHPTPPLHILHDATLQHAHICTQTEPRAQVLLFPFSPLASPTHQDHHQQQHAITYHQATKHPKTSLLVTIHPTLHAPTKEIASAQKLLLS